MPITYNQSGVTYDAAAYTYDGEAFQSTVFPIAGVYIAFTDGPYVASPAWTEVTQYVRGITTHRGRASDLDQFDTGTAQLVLDNRDRRFDPFYTSGPYYPNGLTPRRQIRIVGQIGGSTYEVFRGFIAGWPVTWSEAGYDSTVTIQCFDALGLMATEVVPTDWVGYYTTTLSPRRYWRCNDPQTTQILVDQGVSESKSNLIPQSVGNRYFDAATNYPGITAGAVYIIGGFVNSPQPVDAISPTDITVSFVTALQVSPGSTIAPVLTYIYRGLRVQATYTMSTGILAIELNTSTGSRIYSITGVRQNTAYHYVIAIAANAGGTPSATIYENGQTVTPTSTTPGSVAQSGTEYANLGSGSFTQEVAVFTSVLTSTQATTLYGYIAQRLSETTSARMQRLLDTTDWPAALEGFPASPVGTVAEIGSGTGVIPELQLVADSEGGELYVSKTGVLTMTARRDVFNATRSANVQATFTDSGVGIRYGTELQIQYDADNLKNDITVNYSGDGEVNVYNDTVITGYGAASTTIETQLDSPTSALDLATLELGVEGVLVPQISPIDVSPNTAAADWQSILGLELLDRVNFKRTPTVGNQFNRDALVNAIDHQVEPGVWRTQLTLSMRYTSPLTLNDSVLGKLDYNYLG